MMHLGSRCDLQSMSDASHPLETSGMSPQQHHQSGLLLVDEQKMVDIENPHHHDVLCGRGVTTNRHPGNESFRSLVGLNKELYVTSTKRQKMSISRSIVEAVRSLDPPGRFLEKDRTTGLWSDIGDKKAVEKTSQALRDGAANLRKQLSADMGDPDFLNAVFEYTDDCQERKSDLAKKAAITEGKAGTAAGKTKVPSQDRMDTDLVVSGRKSYEKIKVAKKAKQNPMKKGHRRTRSNPCSGTMSTKNYRRTRPTEPPPSPLAQFAERYPQVQYSPRTPQPRQSVSHPNSPMTWGGRMPYHEREEGPGPQGPNPVYSNYEYSPPSPGPSPSYIHSSGERHYGRSHSYEYHYDSPCEGRPPHLSHQGSWSYSASRYQPSPYRERPPAPPSNSSTNGSGLQYSWQPHEGQELSGYPPAGSCTPPRPPRSSSPSPASPVPQGPLPPGRHQFSPAGYRSDHRGGEWQPPRDVSRRHERHPGHSPRNPHESSGHHSDSSPRWRRSPHSHEHYSTPPPACYSTSFSNTSADRSEESGLSVPSLGAEVRHHPISSVSSRVMLSPRSWSSYGETPPRPPTMSSARDFDPPPPSPKFRRIRRYEEKYPREWEREEYDRASPPGEEKKTEFDRTESFKEENRAPYPPMIVSSSQRALHMNRRKMSSPSHSEDSIKEGEDEDEEDNALNNKSENGRSGSVRSSPTSVTRASPLSTRINNTVIEEGTEGPSKVDEIAMSPIHMGREDPTTLMELPDNILSLPISPCGPHDDPLS